MDDKNVLDMAELECSVCRCGTEMYVKSRKFFYYWLIEISILSDDVLLDLVLLSIFVPSIKYSSHFFYFLVCVFFCATLGLNLKDDKVFLKPWNIITFCMSKFNTQMEVSVVPDFWNLPLVSGAAGGEGNLISD